MKHNRTLVVQVTASVIGDGEIAAPKVGSLLTGPLQFVELPDSAPDAAVVSGVLEPSERGPILQYTGVDSPRRWEWSGLLRGDGWTATWRGFGPRTGRVELTGRFYGDFGHDTDGRFRGRVTRAQIVAERYRRQPGEGWVPVPGFRTLRDVDAAPRFIGDTNTMQDGTGEVDLEIGVLVHLDLDDVPTLPARASIVPGDLSAAGGKLWFVDDELPLVVCLDADRAVTEYVLPSAVGISRRVHATPAGCWVSGLDGTYWCALEAEPVRVDERPVHNGAVRGDTFLACTDSAAWVCFTPDEDPVEVAGAAGYVASIEVVDDGFVAVVRIREPEGQGSTRLVHVTAAGEATVGPDVSGEGRRHGDPYLAGDPLRLVRGVDIAVVQPDRSVRDHGERLGRQQFRGGGVGPMMWTIGHPPDGSGEAGWWPLPGPVVVDRTEQFWLFTLYDGRTLLLLTSVPVFTTNPPVTVDDDGQVYVIARGVQMLRSDDPVMQWPRELDVAGLLDESRRP